ncbi:NAD(P)-dependent oxidoreductase [Myxococcota bacterium]|nr:NAD(P)-dependent oxidoreductase [Myxococcota bacterium]
MRDQRVGFVGLGDMGGPIAQRIIDAGFRTTLWSRRPESLERYRSTPAAEADSLISLGSESDVIGICVFDDDDVKQVVLNDGDGILYGMSSGGVIAIHSTIGVSTCRELEDIGKQRGVFVLDAPVSGSRARQSAVDGELVVMVGGDSVGFETARPVFESYASVVCRVGPIGSGQKAKLINNVLGFCNFRIGYLALQIADELGLDGDAFKQVLCNGSGQSATTGILINQLIPNPEYARHAATMTEKDTRLFNELCEMAGVDSSHLGEMAEEAIGVVKELGQ